MLLMFTTVQSSRILLISLLLRHGLSALCHHPRLQSMRTSLFRRKLHLNSNRNRNLHSSLGVTRTTGPISTRHSSNGMASEVCLQINEQRLDELQRDKHQLRNGALHLIFLVHGYMGNPNELCYLQTALERQLLSRLVTSDQDPNDNHHHHQPYKLLSHSVVANNGKTYDGIAAGGMRVAQEVNEIIDKIVQIYDNNKESENTPHLNPLDNNVTTPPTITLSFVGHSLGGLYARYALKFIDALNPPDDVDTTSNSEGKRSVHILPKVFCTTATPHLGTTRNTYLYVPRPIEWFISQVMLSTGRDLFRTSSPDVIQDMAVEPEFVRPLQAFETRLLYANAFATDFQVPTATAAFLADIDSIHRFQMCGTIAATTFDEHVNPVADSKEGSENDFSVLVVETPYQPVARAPIEHSDEHNEEEQSPKKVSKVYLDNSELARRLDAMGWTKVFCDVRPHLWSISNPFAKLIPFSSPAPEKPASFALLETTPSLDSVDETMTARSSPTASSFTSSQLLMAVGRPQGGAWHAPTAHTVLVANSKNEQYAKWNAAGRPIMDQLARDLIKKIVN